MEKRYFAFRVLGVGLLVLLFSTVGYMQDGMLIEDAIASELVPDDSPTAISYYIKGRVGNGSGQVISIHFPHRGLDFRQVVTIENDEFVMTGKAERGEFFRMHFESDINSTPHWSPYFLIEDTLVIEGIFRSNPDMGDMSYIDEFDVTSGTLNQMNFDFVKRFYADQPSKTSPQDSVYISLARDYFLTQYDYIYHDKAEPLIAIHGLKRLVNELLDLKIEISEKEKLEVVSFFDDIRSGLEPLSVYQELQQKINALTRKKAPLFKDFELEDRASMGTKLSALISEKKVVLVDFWWSGCVPCRQLNKELPAIYEAYKDKGFEIVSISSDRSVSRWEKASEMDKIYWPNLYAGYDSPCLLYYDIRSYPNALILDEKQQIIAKGKLSKRVLLDILKERLE